MAAGPKAMVCGRSPTEIVGSNPSAASSGTGSLMWGRHFMSSKWKTGLVSECSVYSLCECSEEKGGGKTKCKHQWTSKHDLMHLRPRKPQDFCLLNTRVDPRSRKDTRTRSKHDTDRRYSTRRQVYIKLTDNECVQALLQGTGGQAEYKHKNEEVSTVRRHGRHGHAKNTDSKPTSWGGRRQRSTLAPYGKIVSIKEESWLRTYRYAVANGIRQVKMTLTKHIHSHMTVLTSCECQPLTC